VEIVICLKLWVSLLVFTGARYDSLSVRFHPLHGMLRTREGKTNISLCWSIDLPQYCKQLVDSVEVSLKFDSHSYYVYVTDK
jgi:hypothetical protein